MTTTKPATVKWHESPMVGFDTESTGTDTSTARIVQAAVVHHTPGQRPRAITWLIDPGVDIPTEASDVHGYTNDVLTQRLAGAQATRTVNGITRPLPRDAALGEIASQLAMAMSPKIEAPVVIANAPYDTTLLDADLARNGVDPISARPTGWAGVIDPMVLDKAADQYRKQCYKAEGCDPAEGVHVCGGCRGSRFYDCKGPDGVGCGVTDRKLSSLCAHYGIPIPGAHDASVDAVAAVRLARKLGTLYGEFRQLRLPTVHKRQVEWRAAQCSDLRKYFDRVGKDHDGLCPAWPVHTGACASWHQVQPSLLGGVA